MPTSPSDARAPAQGRLDALELRPGTLIADKYRLVRAAGFGGMGAVWVAKNEATNAEVAIKLLLADRAASPEANARFRREAHAAARLSHRGIVRVFDLVELSGADAGSLVMVMELLRGQTLADLLDRRPKLAPDEAVDLMLAILSALAHAHAVGVVHRDLKPDNIFLATDPDGHVTPKILDFGISKISAPDTPRITGDGAMLGTPSYMSPEQARGSRDTDARSDVFTAGILFYEILAGKSPFGNESYHSVIAAILEREPAPLRDVSDELNAAILRALSKSPAGRFNDAAEFALAVREAVPQRAPMASVALSFETPAGIYKAATSTSYPPPREKDEVTSDVSGTSGPTPKLRRRPRAVAYALVAGVLASLAFVVVRGRPQPPPEPAASAATAAIPPTMVIAPSASVATPDVPSAPPRPAASAPSVRPAPARSPAAHPVRPLPPPVTPASTPKHDGPLLRDPGF